MNHIAVARTFAYLPVASCINVSKIEDFPRARVLKTMISL